MIARIRLTRPEKRNALDRDTILRLRHELRDAAEHADARCVLITAEGKDFCSGADLSELQRIRDAGTLENFQDARILGEMFQEMRRHPLPIIAAVRDARSPAGVGLATACDLVLASNTAQFGYPEVNIGFVPAMVMAILRRSVSEKRAFELLATGKVISAGEAYHLGMVNQVYADGELDEAAEKLAAEMDSRSSSAVQLTKYLLYHMDGLPFGSAIEAGAQMNGIARMTEDCRKGIDRFLKKES